MRVGGRTRGTDVIETACGNGIDKRWPHPAPCPTALTDHLVQLLSEPGDLVCDPFAGSGGTGASALSLGRKFVGIDLSSRYVEMANERLSGGCLA